MKLTDFDPIEDQDRVFEYRNFKLVHTDPYGFVHIERIGPGVLPQVLDNQVFTERTLAEKAIDLYLAHCDEAAEKKAIPKDNDTKKTKARMAEMEAEGLRQPVDSNSTVRKYEGKL